jgi:hypothetical protein
MRANDRVTFMNIYIARLAAASGANNGWEEFG